MGEGFVTRRGGKVGVEPGIVIEPGLIVEFFGSEESIPSGWALCDGTNDTPDLRNKFILGAGDNYNVGNEGGFLDAALIEHNHTATLNTTGLHDHSLNTGTQDNIFGNGFRRGNPDGNVSTGAAGAHSHSVSLSNSGSSPTNANLPPYYSLFYIVKLGGN